MVVAPDPVLHFASRTATRRPLRRFVGVTRWNARNCPMKIAVPRETAPGETRVALTPQAVVALLEDGVAVVV